MPTSALVTAAFSSPPVGPFAVFTATCRYPGDGARNEHAPACGEPARRPRSRSVGAHRVGRLPAAPHRHGQRTSSVPRRPPASGPSRDGRLRAARRRGRLRRRSDALPSSIGPSARSRARSYERWWKRRSAAPAPRPQASPSALQRSSTSAAAGSSAARSRKRSRTHGSRLPGALQPCAGGQQRGMTPSYPSGARSTRLSAPAHRCASMAIIRCTDVRPCAATSRRRYSPRSPATARAT
jgi:hypothetical protein